MHSPPPSNVGTVSSGVASKSKRAIMLPLYRPGGNLRHRDAGCQAEAGRVILAARDKLAAEGKPADPNMTVREAYEVLQG